MKKKFFIILLLNNSSKARVKRDKEKKIKILLFIWGKNMTGVKMNTTDRIKENLGFFLFNLPIIRQKKIIDKTSNIFIYQII